MQQPLVLEGTWAEVQMETARLAQEHAGERVRLIVVSSDTEASPAPPSADEHFYRTASPEEFIAALDALAIRNRDLPVLPPEAFERESIYEDRW